MRILITGGTGFIGSHLANHFTDNGHEVIVIGTKTEQTPRAARFLGLHLGVACPPVFYPYSTAHRPGLQKIGSIDVCFHMAGNNDTLDLDRDDMMYANFEAPTSLFHQLWWLHNCRKFVYASSTSVYGNSSVPYLEDETPYNPLNPYAESKMEFDKWAMDFAKQSYKTSVVGLRYTNVYGFGENHKGKRASMIHQLVQTMIKGNSPNLFWDGSQLRDWVYIKDIVKANVQALTYPESGIFNCGLGHAHSFNELIDVINKKLGKDIRPTWIDCPFKTAYQTHTQADMTKAKEMLGFVPVYGIQHGIEEFIDAIK